MLPAELDCHRLYKTTFDQTSKDSDEKDKGNASVSQKTNL